MMRSVFSVAFLFAGFIGNKCGLCWASSTLEQGWSIEDFPMSLGVQRVHDPDDTFRPADLSSLETKLQEIETSVNFPVGDDQTTTVDVQIAVVVVKKLNTFEFRRQDDPEMSAVESVACKLHDKWGVGYETSAGGSGLLILLSTVDRVMYISRGGAISPYLTDARIDRIILNLRPFLKGQKYHDALINASDMILHLIESGKPNWQERLWNFLPNLIPVGFVSAIAAVIYMGIRRQQREDREYARVRSELNRLDRAQAEALQGQYRATSCPICFEDFVSTTIGSDEQPIKLLRCGHVFDETCWAEWVSSGTGNVTRCPICQRDVGTNDAAPPDTPSRRNGQHRHNHHHAMQQDAVVENARDDNDWVMRQFRRERNFRLMRLGRQFPQYVRPHHIQRWTQSTYDGTLATDRTFVQSDPRVVRQAASQQQQRNNSSRSTFGGGGSSGGRGGRW